MTRNDRHLFFFRQRQGREMEELKGRNVKLESDNQELKQMTVKVCFCLTKIIQFMLSYILLLAKTNCN
jgi:hypothetical protein